MKKKNTSKNNFSFLLVFYLMCIWQLQAQQKTHVDPVTEIMGMVGLAAHTESTAQNTYKFINSSSYRIAFTYKGKQVYLDPGAYSEVFTGARPFKGSLPSSMWNGLLIDGFSPANYRQFENSWQNIIQQSQKNNELMHRSTTEEPLKKGIADCENLTKQIQQLKSTNQVSQKFIEPKVYSMDKTIESLTIYINSAKAKLEKIEKDKRTNQVTVSGANTNSNKEAGTATVEGGGQANAAHNLNNQQDKSAADRMADEERVLQIVKEQQQTIAYKQQEINQAASDIGNMFGQAMAANLRNKEEAYEREQSYRQKNELEARAIMQVYEKKANNGDEVAIAQMIRANKLLGYGQEVQFMDNMIEKYNSPVAIHSLYSHYESVISTYKQTRKKYINKTISTALFSTGVVIGLGYWYNSIDIYEEPDRKGMYDALGYLQIGSIVGGIAWTLANGVKINAYSSEKGYIDAESNLKRIKALKASISFYPNYDIRTKTAQLALRVSF